MENENLNYYSLQTQETNKDILDMLNENNRVTELKITFDLFSRKDEGLVDVEELGNIMKSLGYEHTETELEDMIYEVCKDSEKKINFEQFMSIMNKRGKEVDLVEEYTEAFRVFDRDGNGTINKDELKQILITLGDSISPEEVEYMLRDSDVNEDGMIEYKKFVRLMLFK